MRIYPLTFALALAVGAGTGVAGAPDVFGRAFGPKGKLIVAKPTIIWEVWSTGQDRIVGATATIDGRPVRAHYDSVLRRVIAEPAAALPAGKHVAEIAVRFSDDGVIKKDWEFEVAPNALSLLPDATSEQLRALAWANTFRRKMDLPEFSMDSRLNLASMLHSRYLAANDTTGHYQKPDKPEFLAAEPGDRVAATGIVAEIAEVVEFGSGTPEEALRNLVDAPYHRIPFLQPGQLAFGSGYHRNRLTATITLSTAVQTVFHPYDNQDDVPVQWDRNERPNPFRIHGSVKRPVGYPVMLVHFSREPLRITVRSAKLTDGQGAEVPCYLNTPQNDDQLINAMFLIPKSPLAPNKTYVAQVSASAPGGVDVSRTWSFSTRAK